MRSILTALVLAATIGGGGASAQPAGKISDGVVRIGLLLDMSGAYADITGPGSETAAKLAAEDFGNTVLGAPIEVVVADMLNKPDVATAKAREWFDAGQVDAIMDVVGSSAAFAVQQVGRNSNKIVVMNAPASLRLINDLCSPTSVLYTYTTYGLANTVGKAVVAQGGKSWFFIAADYAFGAGLVQDTTSIVKAAGGTVLGSIKHPLGATEFSTYLVTAQASNADVIGLADAGNDMINAVKQAREFGIGQGTQRLAALVGLITDIHSLGLSAAQGLLLSESFYWDLNDQTRAWSKRFFARMGRMPTMLQAGVYSSTMHYLQAIQAAGTDETAAVMKAMRSMPVHDFFASSGYIRDDGLMVHDMYLFQVKTPAESKGPWDYYKLVATIPGDRAFPPLADSSCPLVKK